MKMLGRASGVAAACLLVALVWAVGVARGDSMAIAPNGQIVVTGRTFPEFGALALLNSDGTLNQTFERENHGGYMIDTRLPSFVSVALQTSGIGDPSDRILAGAMGGFQLARYTTEGNVDFGFGHDGIGGTEEPDQVHFLYPGFGPTSLLVRPDQSIVVGGNRTELGAGDAEAWVKGYTATGGLRESIGHLPPPGGPAGASYLHDMLEGGDGNLYGVGSTYRVGDGRTRPFLARFLPGSGSEFDPSFAGGTGLARIDLPTTARFTSSFDGVKEQGEKLLVAGRTGGTVLLARFGRDGKVDSSFGEGGYVAPPIAGPAAGPGGQSVPDASSWANDVAVTADGHVLVAGGTTQWGHWVFSKSSGFVCGECPQPILLRFTADGKLDQGFGAGGFLRLQRPDGGTFEGDVEEVAALADGKLLIKGTTPSGVVPAPFVGRLNSDGSYDASFGGDGLTVLDFPCTDEGEARKRQLGCVPRLRPHLRLFGMRAGRPAVILQAKPTRSWAGIYEVNLTLPRGMRLKKGFRSKLRVVPVGSTEAGKMEVGVIRPGGKRKRETLLLQRIGIAGEVRVRLPRGSLRVDRHLRGLRPHRRVGFRVSAQFTHLGWGGYYGYDAVARRVG